MNIFEVRQIKEFSCSFIKLIVMQQLNAISIFLLYVHMRGLVAPIDSHEWSVLFFKIIVLQYFNFRKSIKITVNLWYI